MRRPLSVLLLIVFSLSLQAQHHQARRRGRPWAGFGQNAQHTGISPVRSQPMRGILWQTPVDLNPQTFAGELAIHYGSPLVTERSVIFPVKTSLGGDFRVDARSSRDGSPLWSLPTDYVQPPHNWILSFGPVLAAGSRVYFAGSGGTVYFRDQPDEASGVRQQIAFYGLATYTANRAPYDTNVMISTPLTADSAGNIYFGFEVLGATPIGLRSGIARISAGGQGTWTPVSTAAADPTMSSVAYNCAPALSSDLATLYIAVHGNSGGGYLLALDSTTLAPRGRARLKDPAIGDDALLLTDSSASPTVGWDGDVYFGVFSSGQENHGRGWLLHFDATLAQSKTPGSFGWDTTSSIVPASMVPSYTGTSPYLLMTKYNDYQGTGGSGLNRLAVLDPNQSQRDSITGVTVMKEVLTIAGTTPDGPPPAVKEWCITSAAVDPWTRSVIVNSEDGSAYRWDLTTNTFSEKMVLTSGVPEPYDPTLIGPDGAMYVINGSILFALGDPTANLP